MKKQLHQPFTRIFAALTMSATLAGCYSDELNHQPRDTSTADITASREIFNSAVIAEADTAPASCDTSTVDELAENGEISASEFSFTACDNELSSFESENGFSFDQSTSFDNSEESEFGAGFSGSFASEEQESFSFNGTPENRQATKPKPPRRNTRFQDHNMSAEQAFARAERTVGIPTRVLRRIVNNEAIGGSPNSVNPDTGACGLGQLMPESTLPEMAYKYGPTFGFNVRDMVDRYIVGKTRGLDIIGYRPHRGERTNLRAQCLDEWTNVALFSMNLVEKMRRVDEQMARKGRRVTYNEADIYVAHFLGARDDIIWARRANPNAHAADFANRRTIRGNRHMFYDSNNRPRTLAGMYVYINKGGPGPDQNVTVTPFWRTETTQIAARAQPSLNAG